MTRLDTRLADQGMSIEVSADAKNALADRGFDPVLGARPLRRTIQQDIEDPLSEKILFNELHSGQRIYVDVEGEGPLATFTFRGEMDDRVLTRSKDEKDNTGAIPEAGPANDAAGKPEATEDSDGKAVAQASQTTEE